jgi:hypothetical protein
MKKRVQQSRPSYKNTELFHGLKERNEILLTKIITSTNLSILFLVHPENVYASLTGTYIVNTIYLSTFI